MTPTRWQEIERVYHAALARPPADRVAFLVEVCKSDAELRREVESLLAQDASKTGTLDRPAWAELAFSAGGMATPIALGTQLGPYKIEALLGKGGMGEVFRGVDIRLGRSVAVKASREQFSARFGREARAISALNNPHICTLYDVGPSYLVMELCEGETLAARLERGKLSIQETVRHGAQIADALSAAHTKGIVHRDLKPANVMLAKAGVKVLDFGLAKSAQDETLTASHVVIGTPAYMAPEQREAKDCDARTDIYALGLILYEMASGKRWQLDQPAALDELPGTFAHVVERCLERDPEDRWQSARDLQRELQWAVSSRTDAAPVAPVGATLSNRIVWSVAAALAIALGAALWAPWRKAPPAPEVKRYQVPLKVVNPTEPFVELAVSPDGRHLAYLDFGGSVNRLWLHSLDTVEVRAMPGWEVTRSRNNNNMPAGRGIVYPFWSPDSQYIAFVSGGKLKKGSISGGPPQTICDLTTDQMPSGSWNRDGVILVGGGGSIWRVPDTGGTPSPVVAPHGAEKRGGFFPFFLPDGRHFLYYGSTTELETGAVYVGSLDAKPETQGTKPLLTADTAAVFAPDPGQPAGSASGYLLFARDRTLLFQRFDAKRLQLVGEAVPITDQVGRYSILPSYSVSTNGVLIYYPGYAPTLMSQVTVVDRKGNVTGTLGEPVAWARGTAGASRVKFSPDGKRFALPIIDPGNSPPTADLWISDLRGFRTRLTFGPGSSYNPVWSPDGSRIAYRRSIGDNDGKMYWKAADGTGNEEPLAVTGLNPRPTSWSNDGRYLLYDVQGEGQNSYDIWVLPLKGDSKPFPFLRTPADEHEGAFSPNGRWVAYVSNETGSFEIFVRPFPPSNRGKWLVSKGMVGSTLPGWRKDGKELTYIDRDANMTSVTVTQDSVFQPGEPTPLFKVPSVMLGALPDRNAFLAGMPIGAAASTSKYLTVVLNWQSGLKK